jgi:hypothetical protein
MSGPRPPYGVPSGFVVATTMLEVDPTNPYGPPVARWILMPQPADEFFFGSPGASYIGPDGGYVIVDHQDGDL